MLKVGRGNARLRRVTLIGVCLLFVALTPNTLLAQTAPTTGGAATIASGEPVLLRAEPSYEAAVLASLNAGAAVDLVDGPLAGANGTEWYGVVANGQSGYVPAGSVAAGDAATADPAAPPPPVDQVSADTSPVATADVNLRAGPSTADAILLVVPTGGAVMVTGDAVEGYLPVSYQGTAGWVDAAYISSDAAAPVADAAAAAPVADAGVTALPAGAATTTEDVNLRAGPTAANAVLAVLPPGSAVTITGAPQGEYTPVQSADLTGWVASSYLSTGEAAPDATTSDPAQPDAATPGDDPVASGSTGIVWPMSGGTWNVIQGYNNGTHTNRSAFAQYHYSLDFARSDGQTAGQPVFAPVSGTIRWIDRGSGGMLIDAGNGYGIAFFHVTIDGGFSSGQQIERGQPVGSISGPGGEGYMSTPHIDLTCWQLTDGGHTSTPFVGPNAISGQEFPDTGGANQHMGVAVNP
ncbi:MAG: SH3 domain-containing protein [Chloroflexota bacterium]|nr:SH3 domain-containing protein [Chloroflexota bacterium]